MRRALRVQDNTPLSAAVQDANEVIPILCLREDPRYLEDTVRRRFLRGLIRDCDENLQKVGSKLFLRVGNPEVEIPAAVRAHGADAVYAVRVYDAAGVENESRITSALKEIGANYATFKDSVLFEGDEVLTTTGAPYRVFTPYKRAWLARVDEMPRPLPTLRAIVSPSYAPGDTTLERLLAFKGVGAGQGETQALKRLTAFLANDLRKYRLRRDFPGTDGTSRLSPYLANGAISIRRVCWMVQEARSEAGPSGRASGNLYVSELIWREFYYQIVQHFPFVLERAFRHELNNIAWSNDRRRFSAWCEGRTGYPIVDAAMRQLNAEGWMHNRARMIVASFLTKDLHISWQWGEKYFFEKLIDADLASNNGGWQWTAGTGTDASPWFRIFNPILQGQKFDPEGTYIRTYLPELTQIPQRVVHTPWLLAKKEQRTCGCVLGKDYPLPMVNHSEERTIALALYKNPGSSYRHLRRSRQSKS
jgi:deoxyribodipyrimidine photo-lyase